MYIAAYDMMQSIICVSIYHVGQMTFQAIRYLQNAVLLSDMMETIIWLSISCIIQFCTNRTNCIIK
jgi:hypothetical protein